MCVCIYTCLRAHTHTHTYVYYIYTVYESVDLFIASAPARPFSSPPGASVRLRLPEPEEAKWMDSWKPGGQKVNKQSHDSQLSYLSVYK